MLLHGIDTHFFFPRRRVTGFGCRSCASRQAESPIGYDHRLSALKILNTSRAVKVLTAFFAGKLDDSSTVKHALGGILTLSSLPTFSPGEADVVLQA